MRIGQHRLQPVEPVDHLTHRLGDARHLAGRQAARGLPAGEVPLVAEAMRQVIERLDRLQSVLPDPRAGEQAEAQRAAAAAYGRSTAKR